MPRASGSRRALAALATAACALALAGCDVLRVFFPSHAHESQPPELASDPAPPALLVFTKTNGFRHTDAIPRGVAEIETIANRRGWSVFHTENGAVFNDAQLARFQAVVWHQVSGDVLDPAQREALKGFITRGGGWVGIHGAGGDRSYDWPWYVDELLGAQFIGHPMSPQFQTATWRTEDASHPASAKLPATWRHEEEIYSFAQSPRGKPGFHVLVSVDESTYSPVEKILLYERSLAMGSDHPMVWWHCVGRGRVLYDALGHRAEAYDEPEVQALIEGALAWALRQEGQGCD